MLFMYHYLFCRKEIKLFLFLPHRSCILQCYNKRLVFHDGEVLFSPGTLIVPVGVGFVHIAPLNVLERHPL